uniref:Ubiquitin-like modifier-activating enzyme ATG7 n=1 Tax=Polyandrocarpa misakiensis TaxID=7723 RepID=A0A1W7GYR9_POLMI|nr:ubiquitin-activating enzyme E1 [Polyandrocarpa misakiensis]
MSFEEGTKLQFVPFSSTVSPGFWYQLVDKKLNVFKLDDSPKEINGFYTNFKTSGMPCQHNIEFDSFDTNNAPPSLCFLSPGVLFNKNTIEEFKESDKKALLESQADVLWDDIKSGRAISDPSLLCRFMLLTFADLKKYQFYYWFAFSAFLQISDHFKVKSATPMSEFPVETLENLASAVTEYKENKGFFLLSFDGENKNDIQCHSLEDFKTVNESGKKYWFVFSDPSGLNNYPGWLLRNFLLLIMLHWIKDIKDDINVLCLRLHNSDGKKVISNSLLLKLKYCHAEVDNYSSNRPPAVGWEKNKTNKLRPRHVDLAENMDPKRLAESAVDLNLKLMRWRLMPSIDLDKISNSKCLLLGSGTLGCNVARALLGWGVKNITLLDYGKVSFSNPVRQSLFEFTDCSTSGGRPKALAAAERLTKIFPGVNATGVELSIPMPGHPVDTNEKTLSKAKEDVQKLEELIDTHNAVFLLMDSRESRWLPTLLCSAKGRLVINAALGFDSYLIMRHGVDTSSESLGACASHKLGCYFCNDVVAPGNSIRDRTLDQQCTVSRPGVSMIASALAAELFVSVIQHKDEGGCIPQEDDEAYYDNKDEFPLGKIPHQIRGFLSHYQTLLPTTYSFSKCTACSELVLDRYRSNKVDFLLEVFNSPPKYLEDVTGLTQLHQETALAEDEILELSDCESI